MHMTVPVWSCLSWYLYGHTCHVACMVMHIMLPVWSCLSWYLYGHACHATCMVMHVMVPVWSCLSWFLHGHPCSCSFTAILAAAHRLEGFDNGVCYVIAYGRKYCTSNNNHSLLAVALCTVVYQKKKNSNKVEDYQVNNKHT